MPNELQIGDAEGWGQLYAGTLHDRALAASNSIKMAPGELISYKGTVMAGFGIAVDNTTAVETTLDLANVQTLEKTG